MSAVHPSLPLAFITSDADRYEHLRQQLAEGGYVLDRWSIFPKDRLYSAYFSDRPLSEILPWLHPTRGEPFFWIAPNDEAGRAALDQGLTDYFLPDHLHAPLLSHCLRLALRRSPQIPSLQPSEAHYRALYTKTPAILHSINREGDLLYVSQRWLDTFGYERHEVIGRKSVEFLTPASRTYAKNIVLPEFFRTGTVENIPYQFVKKNGEIVDILLSSTAEYDEQGQIKQSLAILQDVTEANQTAQALEHYQQNLENLVQEKMRDLWDREAQLSILFDLAPMGIAQSDFTGRMILVNQRFAQMLGYTPSELIGTNFLELTHPDDREITHQAIENILEKGQATVSFEKRYQKKDGSYLWIHLKASIIYDAHNQPQYFLGIIDNIEEKRKIETWLRKNQEDFNRVQAMAHIGHWEWTRSTNTFVCSDEIYRLFDIEPLGDRSVPFRYFSSYLSRQDWQKIIYLRRHILHTGESAHLEHHIITRHGEEKQVFQYAEPVRDRQGQIVRLVGTMQDITPLKKISQDLQTSETRFQELVEHIDQSFWINPPNPTHVSYVSPAYERIWGRSCQSLLDNGESWLEAVHPDDRPAQQAALQRMAQGEAFNEEYRIVRPDQTIRWIHARSFPVRNETGKVLRHVGVCSDVTDRKVAELSLARSEARFRGLFDQAALGIAQISLNGYFTLVNQAFCDLLGYTNAELLQMQWQEITHPEDRTICIEPFQKVLSQETQSMTLEKRYLHKQGQIIWIKVTASLVFDELHQDQCILGIIEDITLLRKIQSDLIASEQRYRHLVENNPAIIYRFSNQAGGTFYSARVQEILGYSPDYLIAHPQLWHDSIHPEDLPKVDRVLSQSQLSGFSLEYRLRDRQGQWRWIDDRSLYLQHQGEEVIIEGIALDITERKRAAENIQYRLRLETALAQISSQLATNNPIQIPEILAIIGTTLKASRVYITGFDERITEASMLWEWTDGISEARLPYFQKVNMQPFSWWMSHLLQRQAVVVKDLESLPPEAKMEHKVLIQAQVHCLISVPIYNHQEQLWGTLGCDASHDNRKVWQGEDLDILTIVGDLIYSYYNRQQTQAQLQQAKEIAEAANQAKSQFLANMSHELRTPLNAVLGFAQVMARSPLTPKEHQEYLGIIQQSGRHLLSLINDVLDLSKIESGNIKLNLQGVDLYQLVQELNHMFFLKAQTKALRLETQYLAGPVRYVQADLQKLQSVLINLLNNAIKFTDRGGVTLTVERIAPAGEAGDGPVHLRFTVADTGIGIPPEAQRDLFNAFVQLEAGERSGEGTGLGLAISQQFIALMNSEIQVESTPGQGSRFFFTLTCPLGEETGNTGTPGGDLGSSEEEEVYGHQRILIVEDQKANRHLIQELLAPYGFEFREASQGEEGVALWLQWQPHLILMDLRMPVMDGYEAVRQIRALEAQHQSQPVPIFALTAGVLDTTREQIWAAGFNELLPKPLEEENLMEKIAAYLPLHSHQVMVSQEDLAAMHPAWRSQLHKAVHHARTQQIEALITQIPAELGPIAHHLRCYVRRLDFETIAQLCGEVPPP